MKFKNNSILFSAFVGSLIEFYDLMLYGYFATIIAQLFFPTANTITGLLNTFSIFALGYLTRPLGGIVLGYLQDRYGRKYVFAFSIILMTCATFMIGCLPTYAQIGAIAPAFLIIARLLQGFSASGEFCAAIIFIYEHADNQRQQWWCIVPFMGVCVGMLLGSIISLLIIQNFSQAQLLAYGWRIPFWFSLISGVVGIYIRLKTTETPVFLQNCTNKSAPAFSVFAALKSNPMGSLFTLATSIFSASAFYLIFMYTPSHLYLSNYSLAASIKIICGGLVTYIVTLPVASYFFNRVKSRAFFYALVLGLMFSVLFLFSVLSQHTNYSFGAFIILCVLCAAVVAPFAQWWPAVFDSRYRATNFSFIYNCSNMLGGMTPLFVAYLVSAGANNAPGVWLLIVAGICFLGVVIASHRSNPLIKSYTAAGKSS